MAFHCREERTPHCIDLLNRNSTQKQLKFFVIPFDYTFRIQMRHISHPTVIHLPVRRQVITRRIYAVDYSKHIAAYPTRLILFSSHSLSYNKSFSAGQTSSSLNYKHQSTDTNTNDEVDLSDDHSTNASIGNRHSSTFTAAQTAIKVSILPDSLSKALHYMLNSSSGHYPYSQKVLRSDCDYLMTRHNPKESVWSGMTKGMLQELLQIHSRSDKRDKQTTAQMDNISNRTGTDDARNDAIHDDTSDYDTGTNSDTSNDSNNSDKADHAKRNFDKEDAKLMAKQKNQKASAKEIEQAIQLFHSIPDPQKQHTWLLRHIQGPPAGWKEQYGSYRHLSADNNSNDTNNHGSKNRNDNQGNNNNSRITKNTFSNAADGKRECFAYLRSRFSANWAVLERIFLELHHRYPSLRINSMLDYGCGPGTAFLAARNIPWWQHKTVSNSIDNDLRDESNQLASNSDDKNGWIIHGVDLSHQMLSSANNLALAIDRIESEQRQQKDKQQQKGSTVSLIDKMPSVPKDRLKHHHLQFDEHGHQSNDTLSSSISVQFNDNQSTVAVQSNSTVMVKPKATDMKCLAYLPPRQSYDLVVSAFVLQEWTDKFASLKKQLLSLMQATNKLLVIVNRGDEVGSALNSIIKNILLEQANQLAQQSAKHTQTQKHIEYHGHPLSTGHAQSTNHPLSTSHPQSDNKSEWFILAPCPHDKPCQAGIPDCSCYGHRYRDALDSTDRTTNYSYLILARGQRQHYNHTDVRLIQSESKGTTVTSQSDTTTTLSQSNTTNAMSQSNTTTTLLLSDALSQSNTLPQCNTTNAMSQSNATSDDELLPLNDNCWYSPKEQQSNTWSRIIQAKQCIASSAYKFTLCGCNNNDSTIKDNSLTRELIVTKKMCNDGGIAWRDIKKYRMGALFAQYQEISSIMASKKQETENYTDYKTVDEMDHDTANEMDHDTEYDQSDDNCRMPS